MRWLPAIPLVVLIGLVPVLDSLNAQPVARTPRRVALLVGPSEYLFDFKTLPHLDDDVKALAKELRLAGFDEVVVLTDPPEGKFPATRKNILAELDRLLSGNGNETQAIRKDDVVLLAFSGHGQEVFVNNQSKETFFAPIDGKRKDPKTLVNMAEVLEKLGGCGCRNLILADMCREIFDPNKGKGLDPDNLKLPKNSAILFGCESTQESFVNTELKHSLFTYAVLEVLRESNKSAKPLLWSQLVSGVELKFASDEYKKLMGENRQQNPVERKTDLRATAIVSVVAPPGEPKPGEERLFEIANGVKMKFCYIPKGKSMLGSRETEEEREKNEIEYVYTEKVGFWMGKYPVTQEEWTAVMRTTPFEFHKSGTDADYVKRVAGLDTSRFPAENVTWNNAQKFLTKVNERPGVVKVFGKGAKLVLPHEERWEYAYRGGKGNKTAFYWGDELNGDKANCDGTVPYGTKEKGDYLKRPTEVGAYDSKAPHPWGLCDMSGNVWQWCENKCSIASENRVLRGGSWFYYPRFCRAASRLCMPTSRIIDVGFRVCVVLD